MFVFNVSFLAIFSAVENFCFPYSSFHFLFTVLVLSLFRATFSFEKAISEGSKLFLLGRRNVLFFYTKDLPGCMLFLISAFILFQAALGIKIGDWDFEI